MVINVSEALDMDTAKPILVERFSGSGFTDGIYQKGTPSTFKALASVQQATPKELKDAGFGERDVNGLKFISSKPIKTVSDRDGTAGDVVIYKGVRYKVRSSADWSDYGFTRVVGVREK